MAGIKSDKQEINKPDENIFNFLSDFNNFEKLMPEQVANWKSTTEACSFSVSGIGTIGLKISEKSPFSKIVIIPDGANKLPITFNLICNLKKINESLTEAQMIIDAEIPMMLSMMVSKPLQNLVNILALKLKEYMEK